MNEKMQIKVEFSTDSLFNLADADADELDTRECVNRYADLVEMAIREEYPDADVEVSCTINDRVRILNDEYDTSRDVETVNEILERVWNSNGWVA